MCCGAAWGWPWFRNSSQSILVTVKQQELSVVPFPLVPQIQAAATVCVVSSEQTEDSFFFLITFNQCKKKKKKWAGYPLAWLRNSAAWLAAAVLLPLSTKLSQLWYAVFSPSPLTFVEIADGSKFCSSLEKDLSSFSLPTPIFFILTTSLTKTSKSGVPKGILKEASCIFS